MVNLNGEIVSNKQANISVFNRGFAYGDALFETIRVNGNNILYWEDHYFRLMASMRIMRMRIPMNFTLEYLEKQILDTVASHGIKNSESIRVKLSVYRDSEGLYTPAENNIGFFISIRKWNAPFYSLQPIQNSPYVVELYKDHLIAADLLSTLKTNNRAINVLAGIFGKENHYQNMLLLNTEKKVIEATNGNLFLVKNNHIKTPPVSDGCINGVLKKQLIRILKKNPNFEIEETSISPFELQKADELFITNVISGIISVSKYRKKEYSNIIAQKIISMLNADIRLLRN